MRLFRNKSEAPDIAGAIAGLQQVTKGARDVIAHVERNKDLLDTPQGRAVLREALGAFDPLAEAANEACKVLGEVTALIRAALGEVKA